MQFTNTKTTLVILLSSFIAFSGVCQNLDKDRITEWNIVTEKPQAVNETGNNFRPLSSFQDVYNIVERFHADNTGKTDVSHILNDALKSTPQNAVIFFPAGIYLFKRSISVPSHKIIRGASPFLTFFKFDLLPSEPVPFKANGTSTKQYHKVNKAFPKGTNKIIVESANNYFEKGDDLELERENIPNQMYTNPRWNQPSAEWSVGQMLSIKDVVGDTIYLDRTLTLDYNSKFDVRIQKVEMVENIGFEGFSLERVDNNTRGGNFNFNYAKNCWISCIKSYKATNAHVQLTRARNCQIKGSYFDNAYFHCGGGSGYGVLVQKHSTENLIYNNIFMSLRHSLVVKNGANRNVFSYNYSAKTKVSQGNVMADGYCGDYSSHVAVDISIHGHYSYMNLFEHNIVQRIVSADYWGPSGPGTTFFRNRIETEAEFLIRDYSVNHNVIGNIIPGSFHADSTVRGTLQIKNNIANEIDTLPWLTLQPSLYLDAKPDFYGNLPWPSIDPDPNFNYDTNPAKERWKNRKIFDELCCGSSITIPDSRIFLEDAFYVFLKDNTIFLYGDYATPFDVNIYTIDGKPVQQIKNAKINEGYTLNYPPQTNQLVVHIFNENFVTSMLIMPTL